VYGYEDYGMNISALVDFLLPHQTGFSVFTHIQNIKGGLVMHVLLLKEVIHESLLFKHHNLSDMLGDFLQNILSANNSYSAINHHHPACNNITT